MKKNYIGLPLFIKYEVVLASSLIIFVIILLSFFLLLPNITKVDSIIKEKSNLSDKLEKLKNKEKMLTQIQSEDYKTRYSKVNSILPRTVDYISMLNTISNLEKKSGVVIKTTDFKSDAKNEISEMIQASTESTRSSIPILISIEMEGPFENLKRFLESLNKLDGRIFNVYQTAYSKKGENTENLKVIGSFYSYPVNTELGPVESVLPVYSEKQKSMLSVLDSIPVAPDEPLDVSTRSGKIDLFN